MNQKELDKAMQEESNKEKNREELEKLRQALKEKKIVK